MFLKKLLKNIYPEKLHNLHNDLLFLTERMKIEKVEKFVANLHDKTEYIIYTRIKISFKPWASAKEST